MQTQQELPSLVLGGVRFAKDHPRVDAYGSLDELNVFVGAVRTGLGTDATVPAALRDQLDGELRAIQERLVDVADAVAGSGAAPVPSAAQHAELQRSLAAFRESLAPAPAAILPGGVPTTARLHMCRSICDRAERSLVALSRSEPVASETLQYVDLLSAWFLAAARFVAARTDKEWIYG